MRHIDINSDSWHLLIREIVSTFTPGELISHEWLQNKFHLKELKFKDFEDEEAFIEAFKEYQFDYMFLIDTLRCQLLEGRKGYLKNVHGEGHIILPPNEQVSYGYNKFIKTVKSGIKKTDVIMKNVPPVSATQQAIDNDIRARYSTLKQMLAGIKNKKTI